VKSNSTGVARSEDRHGNLDLAFFFVDVFDNAVEGRKWAFGDFDGFADIEQDGWTRTLNTLLDLFQQLIGFFFG